MAVRFKPCVSKKELLTHFDLPENKKIIFFGSAFLDEERKGMPLLLEALKLVNRKDVFLLIAGTATIGEVCFDNKRLGYLNEQELIKAYQVADLFVCPSVEDSGPMMINQSIMCGTPVVAFEMGVAVDLVHKGKTGYRAKLGDKNDLAQGINCVLNLTEEEHRQMSVNCRELALQNFSNTVAASKLNDLLK